MNEKDINIYKMIEEIQDFIKENNGTKNGYYYRDPAKKFGFINNLKVSRDREGEFK